MGGGSYRTPSRQTIGTPARQPAPGDVVVTKVADRYHIGQVHADRNVFTAIAMRTDRDDALALACRFVTGRQRVFTYGKNSRHYEQVDCASRRTNP